MTPFYQLTATRLRGQPLSMADYAGKVVLVVNTASDGTPLTRFAPFTTPEKMEASIVAALKR